MLANRIAILAKELTQPLLPIAVRCRRIYIPQGIGDYLGQELVPIGHVPVHCPWVHPQRASDVAQAELIETLLVDQLECCRANPFFAELYVLRTSAYAPIRRTTGGSYA